MKLVDMLNDLAETRPLVLLVPETPAEHVRNALSLLVVLRHEHPALFIGSQELHLLQRRAELAVLVLEVPSSNVEEQWQAVELVIEAAIAVPVDWQVIEDLPAIVHRLFQALLGLWSDAGVCLRCGGTVLPPTIGGVPRGSCHCRRDA